MIFNFIRVLRGEKIPLFCFLLSFLFLMRPAFADERKWVLTEPYWTVSKGSLELEQWYQAGDSIADVPQNWIELEYGITDREQLAVYEIAQQSNFKYGGYQIENKLRLAKPGQFFLLPTLYLEYRNSTINTIPSELEAKLILEKYIGDLDLATNFIWEKPVTGNELSVHFDRFLMAGSYPVGDNLNAGLEFADYTHDQAVTLTPDLYMDLSHNLRIVGGWEIPLAGKVPSRFRIQMDWEFNR